MIPSAVVSFPAGWRRATLGTCAGLFALLQIACTAACSTRPPRPELADSHPAHPGAAEASWSPELADWTSAAFGAAPPASSAAYACPMHAHRTARTPGRCPECGMELVPSRSAGP